MKNSSIISESPRSVISALERTNGPLKAWRAGSRIDPQTIADCAIERANIISANRPILESIWNTNTIDATLKQDVILQDIIRDFANILLPLRAFSTVFQNVPLAGTKTVQVPFYDLDTTASTAFVAGTGYTTIGNTTVDIRPIIVGLGATNGGRYFQALSFTSEELNFQPYFNTVQAARLKAEALATDIIADVLSVVTEENFGGAALTKAASIIESDDIAGLVDDCKSWPRAGRSLFVDTAVHASLLKDPYIKSAMNSGDQQAIREGVIPRIHGFDYYENPNIPSNSENLIGFASFVSAILFASAPCPPIDEVRKAGTMYQVVVDPQTGIAFEYRSFGDNVTDAATRVIECSYGWAKGNGSALKRIVSS